MEMTELIIKVCPTEFLMENSELTYDEIMNLSSEKEKEIMLGITNNMKTSEVIRFLQQVVNNDTIITAIMNEIRNDEGKDYFGLHYHSGQYYVPSSRDIRVLTKMEAIKYLHSIITSENEDTINRFGAINLDHKVMYMCGVGEETAEILLSLEPKLREIIKTQLIVAYSKGQQDTLKTLNLK